MRGVYIAGRSPAVLALKAVYVGCIYVRGSTSGPGAGAVYIEKAFTNFSFIVRGHTASPLLQLDVSTTRL